MKRLSSVLIPTLVLGILGQYAPAFAQRPSSILRSAIREYYDARFEEAAASLERLLAQPDLAAEVKIEAMQYLGFCCVGMNDKERAKAIFSQILDLRPDYQLPPNTAPKIGRVFQAALDAWKAAHPPAAPPKKAKTPIWQVVLGLGLLAQLLGGGKGEGGGEGAGGFDVVIR